MKLYSAVLTEIKEQKKFSAYDITKTLRDKTNNGTIVIDDVDQITLPNGDDVAEINHAEVNAIIKDVYDVQALPLNRSNGNGYFVYELTQYTAQATLNNLAQQIQQNVLPLNPVKSIQTGNTALQNHLKQMANVNILPAAQPQGKILTGFNKSERHKIYTRVASYVASKRKNSESITLKGISSTLKRKGITVKDISDVCKKLGYQVIAKTPRYKSEVK